MTDAELEARYPWIPWRAPLLAVISTPGASLNVSICRYCAAHDVAFKGRVPFWMNPSELEEHLLRDHPAAA